MIASAVRALPRRILARRAIPRDEHYVRLGLVNNMPDAALESTERQFLNLLDAAAPDVLVRMHFFSLRTAPRGEAGQRHLARNFYRDVSALRQARLDGLIVTGTEPLLANLRDEPYWAELAGLFDWVEKEGPSTIFSCLAAHAAVLHFDGVERRRLAQKRFGLFEHAVTSQHGLTASLCAPVRVAHSRWNEVSERALRSAGYQILTQTDEGDVDLFVKQERRPLLFFQGHPEYDEQTLGREYRRDVRRFLVRERESYPDLPQAYFQAAEAEKLLRFRDRALVERGEALMQEFPDAAVRPASVEMRRPAAAGVFAAWLRQIAQARTGQQARVPQMEAADFAWSHPL